MSALQAEIEALIAAEGPIGLDRYMALALGHPVHGYYVTRDPLGASGDFTTAPEISQMFGELLGLWAAAVWIEMGRPNLFLLTELGPGRGTLMADALRAGRSVPGFLAAASLHLVETSPVLRESQAKRLAASGLVPSWHDDLGTVPDGPIIVLANEFLDALPIRQFTWGRQGWHERTIGLGHDGRLSFALAPFPTALACGSGGREGEVLELSSAMDALILRLGHRIARSGGAALFLDYGTPGDEPGDTFQAVSGHAFVDPLADPGGADLTSHVRFGRMSRLAAEAGAAVHGPVNQGSFLLSLGLGERAARLARGASPDERSRIEAAFTRLAGQGPTGMGELFKAFALSHNDLPSLPGLPRLRGSDDAGTVAGESSFE